MEASIRASDLDAVLTLLPKIDSLSPQQFVSFTPDQDPVFHPIIEELQVALYRHGFIRAFDWPSWQSEAERLFDDPTQLDTADAITCLKLLTLHVRKERFCGGHFAAMLQAGHVGAILHRLQGLRRENRSTG